MAIEQAIYSILASDIAAKAILSTHGLTTADAVTLTTTLADLPAPLAAATTYYARALLGTTISLHPTAANATANTAKIDITDAGSGTHTCIPTARPVEWFAFAADAATDICTSTRCRVYPQAIPQDSLLPCIVYERISTPRVSSLTGTAGIATPRMQIVSWADTYSGAKTLADAVRNALDDYTGEVDGLYIGWIRIEDEGDMIDLSVGMDSERVYGVRQDFVIQHFE